MKTATASPFPTPASARAAARESTSALSSANVSERDAPVSDSPISATWSRVSSRSAQRSTQLRTRFTRPPVNQVAHGIPFEASRTRSYGTWNSIPRSLTAASQYHSTSWTERRLSSSIESMPCARIRRVTCARSTYSDVGSQARSGMRGDSTGGAAGPGEPAYHRRRGEAQAGCVHGGAGDCGGGRRSRNGSRGRLMHGPDLRDPEARARPPLRDHARRTDRPAGHGGRAPANPRGPLSSARGARAPAPGERSVRASPAPVLLVRGRGRCAAVSRPGEAIHRERLPGRAPAALPPERAAGGGHPGLGPPRPRRGRPLRPQPPRGRDPADERGEPGDLEGLVRRRLRWREGRAHQGRGGCEGRGP